MSFASPVFLWYFLPVVVAAYLLLPMRARNALLLASSLLFYAWGGGVFVLLLAVYIVANYAAGLAISSRPHDDERGRNVLLALAVAGNLSMLAVWKYASFVVTQLNGIAGALAGPRLTVPSLTLPIGISFFTFHVISYVVDVRRETRPAMRNPIDFAVYIAMFPQLIAGPIIRYHEIADQLVATEKRDKIADLAEGFPRFALGLLKKVVVADAVAPVVDAVFELHGTQVTTMAAWIGALAYAVQIYFDFSGYSDMAIGLGKMFGFTFPENFARPYSAVSITDFWRRWHMSLSRWFRDYLYIPLGGNRAGAGITYRNLLVVFFLTGLWHGANWTFVVWGLYHGGLLLIERMTGRAALDTDRAPWRRIPTFVLVLLGWVLFRAVSLDHAMSILAAMLTPQGLSLPVDVRTMLTVPRTLALAVGLGSLLLPGGAVLGPFLRERGVRPAVARLAVLGVAPYAAVLVAAGTFSPFLYFQF